jgi:8-oxo-dGTP pyrophosphatase MutT (NUDIX family)
MEFHADRNTAAPLASATVMMLREGASGPEVFMLKRHGLSDVLGGAYVFPGGKVDAEDAQLAGVLDRTPSQLHESLGEPQLDEAQAAALFVAAVREVFEECGVLFADVDPGAALAACALMREGRSFADVQAELGVPLATRGLAPWSRWITPLIGGVVRKRFDARFFVAAAPPGQQPVHDAHETTESVWLTAREALRQYWDGVIQLAPPQIMSLAHVARHTSVESVLAEARGRKPPLIQPEHFEYEGMRGVCYPGDERHSVRERALPGPTRLCWRNQRLEPCEGGLEALTG